MIFKRGDWVKVSMPPWFEATSYNNGISIPNGTRLLLLDDPDYFGRSTDIKIFGLCEHGCVIVKVRFDELILVER